ncbi:hypothetical protein [Clostridium ljungdahlii]|uniref:Uncharacterized protein n=1 Tax=Clostridium ljungdahlii (strain ATCC 55383 / DSM 13528 / PETC) TaxID=748727 RepID=D8GKG8_CLOLD|nr:hypothetical protein [Clostridium ljungdahlii]ADK15308.1 hypothetical protein CLJU_c22480 [Clostridium ljungdahlii DSM 13528]OAA88405.1 hypothetical protein WX45_02725 [Clostridium ljungdahlii DSM 13528]
MNLGKEFLCKRELYLKDKGYKILPNQIKFHKNNIVFYHYTHSKFLHMIFSKNSGLYARRQVSCPNIPEEFNDCYLIEGFLDPLPKWLTEDYYFGNLGFEMVRRYIGNVLLRVELPMNFSGLYIADYAHILDCKHTNLRGTSPLDLGYDISNGHEATQAYVNSYIPVKKYEGKHMAPVIQIIRKEKGIAVPNKYLSVCKLQPILSEIDL